MFNVVHVAARAMLGAEGYDVAKSCGFWIPGWTRPYTVSSARPGGGQHDTRRGGRAGGEVARTVAVYARVRTMLARDTWDYGPHSGRWATGPGTEGMDFPAAVAGAGAALVIGMAAGNGDRALAGADEALAAAVTRQVPRVRAV